MKRRLHIIQYRDGTWGAKRKGLFGWKYLNENYDGNWMWHYGWRYHVPDGIGSNDKFDSKRECIKALSYYYHHHRDLQENSNV